MSSLPFDMFASVRSSETSSSSSRRQPAWYAFPNKDEPRQFTVYVHIYDVGHRIATKGFNDVGRQFNTGVYHAGVELASIEWAFAAAMDGMTGVYRSTPRQDVHHRYRESIAVGEVKMSQNDLEALLVPLQRDWQGCYYDVVRRNCCHFAAEVLRLLRLPNLPPWVMAMTETGAVVEDGVREVKKGLDAARDFWRGLDGHLQLSTAVGEWGFCQQTASAKQKTLVCRSEESVYTIDVRGDEEEQSGTGSSNSYEEAEVPMYASPMRLPACLVTAEIEAAL